MSELNWLSLSFADKRLERRFRHMRILGSPEVLQFSLVTGALLFAVFGFLDFLIGGDLAEALITRRFIIGVPIMSIIAAASFFPIFWRHAAKFLTAYMLASGLALLAMISIANGASAIIYPFGLLIIFFYGAFLIGLDTIRATSISLVLFIGLWVAVYNNPPPAWAVMGDFFFLVLGFAVATVGGWHLEREMRMRFLANVEAHQNLIAAQSAKTEKSQVLAIMSHELRTPLNAIIGFSEIMRMEMIGPLENEKYQEYVRDINSSGKHLLGIINDLLDISRVDMGKMDFNITKGSIAEIVESPIRMTEDQAMRAGVKVKLAISPILRAVNIEVDHRRLRQAVLNLLTNSLKFTDAGGAIDVIVEQAASGRVLLSVRDSGVGIPCEQIETVMEPFAQVEAVMTRENEGLGLGLPIVKRIVEGHGGLISIESTLGEGTVVTISLPENCLVAGAPSKEETSARIAS